MSASLDGISTCLFQVRYDDAHSQRKKTLPPQETKKRNEERAAPNCIARYKIIDPRYNDDFTLKSAFRNCLKTAESLRTMEKSMKEDEVHLPKRVSLTICNVEKCMLFSKWFFPLQHETCDVWNHLTVKRARELVESANSNGLKNLKN